MRETISTLDMLFTARVLTRNFCTALIMSFDMCCWFKLNEASCVVLKEYV